jgi:hypothetical protein
MMEKWNVGKNQECGRQENLLLERKVMAVYNSSEGRAFKGSLNRIS